MLEHKKALLILEVKIAIHIQVHSNTTSFLYNHFLFHAHKGKSTAAVTFIKNLTIDFFLLGEKISGRPAEKFKDRNGTFSLSFPS